MDRGFLGARGPAVDADVAGDEILLVVRVGTLVLGHQPARAGIRAVVQQEPVEVLVGFLVVLVVLGQVVVIVQVERGVRLLLGEQLVEGLLVAGIRAAT